jgi:N-acetyl-anhydromuramyl-L-alanine amidase AmpD
MGNLYELAEFKEKGVNNKKKQIILTDTKRDYKNYINSLRYRYNKENPYLPNYLITKDGDIYRILEPEKYSDFMNDENIDKNSIVIAIENNGWLKKNPLDNTYVNWIGDIYKKEVYEKKWRDYFFWEPYTENQMKTLSNIVTELCEKFKIPKECLGHNVKFDGVEYFKGVVSRSNFDFIFKDVNPSFNFKLFKELLQDDK